MNARLASPAAHSRGPHRAVHTAALVRCVAVTGVLAAAAVARVSVDAARWGGMRGPECVVGQCLGPHACPGCGLVRSVASAVQGEFAQSLAFHPGGLAVFFALAATLAWDLAALVLPSVSRRGCRTLAVLWHATIALVLTGWIVRLFAPASFLSLAP